MRENHLATFLRDAGWQDAHRTKLAGDASNRRYERLQHATNGTAVLMDAPPDRNADTAAFIKIALHLRAIGLSPPALYDQDVENGFLLLEDLGDDLLAKVSQANPDQETEIYKSAADTLIAVQTAQPPAGLANYGPAEMTDTAMLAIDWYLAHAAGPAPASARAKFENLIRAALDTTLAGSPVLVLRDYHAENLLWLPERIGQARIGLLDFQTAMLGHPAYDLASLLKDARRDVSAATRDATLAHYLSQSAYDPDAFRAAFSTASAQRNLRILGGFTRLSVRDDKRHYPELIPRVWNNLMDDLTHPALGELRDFVHDVFSEPSPEILSQLSTAVLSDA